MKWRILNNEETEVVVAILREIERELLRCYWNKNQKQMESPFDNTGGGNKYKCSAFKVHAYDWNDDNNGKNFVYKDKFHPDRKMIVEWYKYLGRGTYIKVPKKWSTEYLPDMLQKCKKAIRDDFGERWM